MMTKTKSKWWPKYKVAFALLVIMLVLTAFMKNTHSLNYVDDTTVKGWVLTGMNPEYFQAGIDNSISAHGSRSAYIQSVSPSASNGWTTLLQRMNVNAYHGKRVKMTGYIKTQGSTEKAQMWIRVDDIDKKMSTEFDNMDSRPVVGSTEWKKNDIVFDVSEKCAVFYGLIMAGTGKVWFDNVTFEVVDKSTPKTTWVIDGPLPEGSLEQIKNLPEIIPEVYPINLDFEE